MSLCPDWWKLIFKIDILDKEFLFWFMEIILKLNFLSKI